MLGLSQDEEQLLKTLSTPQKIQDYLDALPINHEKEEETCLSPRLVLRQQKAHCLEAALLGATALWFHGEKPLIMNFKTTPNDDSHAVTLFRINGYWGALSKTNHPILRYRDPIYRTLRELALTYFHEYFLFEGGRKTLRAYSQPMNVRRFGTKWITQEESVWPIAYALADSAHLPLVPKENMRHLRAASPFERIAVDVTEWQKTDPRT
jgi:hypothetical protein